MRNPSARGLTRVICFPRFCRGMFRVEVKETYRSKPIRPALGPEGAAGCSHGWSGGAAKPAHAEPVEAGFSFSLVAPEGPSGRETAWGWCGTPYGSYRANGSLRSLSTWCLPSLHPQLRFWSGFSLTPGQRVGDFFPKLLPGGSFAFRQLHQGLRSAHAGEIRILLPVMHRFLHQRARFVRFLFQRLTPCRQIGPQPIKGLPAEASSLLVIALIRVLSLAAAGERGRAGGVVAVAQPRSSASSGFLANTSS
jgi:hypothetical protein